MSDLVGAYSQTLWNRESQEEAFHQQRELMRESQAYNTLMWNMSNAYNSPMAQMLRFKAAGLNPNLIYGQMANTSNPISMSTPSAPSPAQAGSPSLLETAQIGLLNAQKENIEADTSSKKQGVVESGTRISKMEAEIDKIGHDNNWTDQQIEQSKATMTQIYQNIDLMKAQEDQVRQAIDNLKSEKNLTDQQVIAQQIDNYWADERNRAQINELKSRTRLNDAQARELIELLVYKQANLASSTALNNANADRIRKLLPAEEYNLWSQAFNLDNQSKLYGEQADQQSIISDFAKEHPGWHYFWNNAAPSVASAVGTVAGVAGAIIIRGGVTKGAKIQGAASVEAANKQLGVLSHQ